VRDRQRKQQDLPPGCVRNAVEQEIEDEIQAGMMSHFLSKQSTNGRGCTPPARADILRGFTLESPRFRLY
jgi:hypothetical protein